MDENILAELKKDPGKKIVIFGAGAGGRVVLQECARNGLDAAYFVDNRKKGTSFEGKEVKDPYDLMYEKENTLLILVSACRESLCREMTEQLEGMGFSSGKDFFIPQTGRNYAPLTLFDPLLGYGRMPEKEGEKEGFRITPGRSRNAPVIAVLGGSTSDPTFGNIVSWVERFAEKLRKKGFDYTVCNGAVAGYCANQELLKFLRDVLPLSPELVITMDGFNDASQPRTEEHPFYHPYLADSLKKLFENGNDSSLEINGKIGRMTFGAPDRAERPAFYLRTLKALHGAAEENEVRHVGFLQPVSSMENFSAFPVSESVRSFYKAVLAERPGFLLDASRILQGVPEAYMDYAHYSEKGNEALSDFVLKSVEGFLKLPEGKK